MQTNLKQLLSIFAVVAAVAIPPANAQTAGPAGDPGAVYDRMQRVNAGLKSYTASIHVDVTTHGFPLISPSLDGTAYFEQPDKSAVVFDTVPVLASQFKKIYPQLEPPNQWPRLYDVTPVSDDGTTSHFRLVRKVNGRIDHVDVAVDDKTATVSSMAYIYKDGGSVSFRQSYDQIDGNYVIRAQTGTVDLPHYNADVTSQFSAYKLNVTIDQSVFATD
jgi:outer membrane lipoprotein-sorting protein